MHRCTMISVVLIVLVLISFFCNSIKAQTQRGAIVGPVELGSRIYPGTVRNYWVYVPAQYVPSSPACLLVVLDGLSRAQGWKLPQVMDSLIGLHQMPVTIGVFVDPGTVTASRQGAYPRYNRSVEYDALGDRYANFLIEELLPEVSKTYRLKEDPNSHAVAGASSGAICAFNVAWERPDQFRRVLSTIGTYVGLRGGDEFPTLVRKTEAKPIRVFLEDGDHDLNIYAGDWWAANQSMLSSLEYAGYEVNHSWGHGGHDSRHAASIMGEAMAWLWKDYPEAVTTHKGVRPRLDLLIDGEQWREIGLGSAAAHNLTVGKSGDILFVDKGTVYRIHHDETLEKLEALAIDKLITGPSEWYGWTKTSRKLVAIASSGKTKTLMNNCSGDAFYATANGIYFSDTNGKRIGFLDVNKKVVRYFPTAFAPGALALSAEKTFLNVASVGDPFGYSFKVNEDGSLEDGQSYVHYHIPYGGTTPGVTAMDVDTENVLYSATASGVQVSDQLGRVNFIFSKPTSNIDDVKLAGNKLFVCGGGRLFVRKIAATGLLPFGQPVTPPKPQL